MSPAAFPRHQLVEDGFVVLPKAIPDTVLEAVSESVDTLAGDVSGVRGGLRNLFRSPEVHALCGSAHLAPIVDAAIGRGAKAVRGLLFDKTKNWQIRWHQDVTIAVKERLTVSGFGPWSSKEEVPHVHAPAEVLANMVALRIHLDDCSMADGPLIVLPGSHRDGRLTPEEIYEWRRRVEEVPCCVERGGVVVMRPLLLHSSQKATRATRRRVLHLEFARGSLPGGLRWHEEVSTA